MFYSQFILAKKGPLGTIWIAAHLERKLRRNQVAETNIGVTVDSILFPEVPIALRLSGHLLLGVVRIYSRQVNYLFNDCSETLGKIKQAINAAAVDLPPEETTAPFHTITLPETFDFDELELGQDSESSFLHFNGNYVDHHVSSREQITLQDCIENNPYLGSSQFGLDERFGDGDYAALDLDFDEDFLTGKAPPPPPPAPSTSTCSLKDTIVLPAGCENEAVCMDIDDPREPLGLGLRNVDLNGQGGDLIQGHDHEKDPALATLSDPVNEPATTQVVSKTDSLGLHAYTPGTPALHVYTPGTPAFHAFTPRALEACTPDLNQEYCPPDEPSTPALAEEASLLVYKETLADGAGKSVSSTGEISGMSASLGCGPGALLVQQGLVTSTQTVGAPNPPPFQRVRLEQAALAELSGEQGWVVSTQTVGALKPPSFHGFPLQQAALPELNREQDLVASTHRLGMSNIPFQGFALQRAAPVELGRGQGLAPNLPDPPASGGFVLPQACPAKVNREQGWALSSQTVESPRPQGLAPNLPDTPASGGFVLPLACPTEVNREQGRALSSQTVESPRPPPFQGLPLQQAAPGELSREHGLGASENPSPSPFQGFPLQQAGLIQVTKELGWSASTQQLGAPKPPPFQGIPLQQVALPELGKDHSWTAASPIRPPFQGLPLQQASYADANSEALPTQAVIVKESAAMAQRFLTTHLQQSTADVLQQAAVLPGGTPGLSFPPPRTELSSLAHEAFNSWASESHQSPATPRQEVSLCLHGQVPGVLLAGQVGQLRSAPEATHKIHGLDAFGGLQHSPAAQGNTALPTTILTGSSAGVAGCETLRSAYDAQIHNVLLHSHTSGESIPALELDRDKSWTASSDPMPKEGFLLQFDKTPTLRDEFLSSAKSSLFSGRSLESLPRDDDVLASILGRRSNPFKVLPTPKAPKPPKPSGANALVKQPKSALKKRKVEIDAFTVLHGDVIRQQLANADDIQRDRRKAPCTRREVWSFIREIEGQENFDEPTVLGIPSDLHNLYHDVLNGFESKLSPPALNGVVKGEQGTEANRVTLDARFEADSHGICLNKDPFESDAIHSSHVSVDSVHENAGNLVLPQEVSERNEDLVGGFREHVNNDMHIHNTSGQPKEGMETDMSTEQLNEKMGRDSSIERPKDDIGIESSTEQAKENMQIDGSTEQAKENMQIDGSIVQLEEDKRIEQPNEGVAEETRGDLQFTIAQAVSSKTLEVNNIDTSTEPQASQGHVTSMLVAMDKDAHEQVPQEVTAIEVGLDGKGRGEGEITISNIPENLVSIVGAEVDQQDRDVGETETTLKERQQHSSVLLPVEGASEGGLLLLSKAMQVPCDAMDGIEMPISLAGGMPISQAIGVPISHVTEIGQGLQATGMPISQASEVPVSHTMDIDDGHVENSNIDLPSNGPEENKILCGYNQDMGTLESERNTGFLDDDNDDVVYAEMDYSGDEQSASVADDHGWSARSRNVGKYLKTVFEEMESSSKGVEQAEHVTLGLERLLARKTRREAARMFFETLVLKTKDYIHVQQNLAYADIHLYPKPKLMKTDF